MHRILVPPAAVRDGIVTIQDSRALHHLLDVLRVKPGDRLECFDGQRSRYVGEVTASSRREIRVAVKETWEESPARLSITLAHALIKPERFEWVLQKATELGVARMVPLVTARATTRLPHDAGGRRLARWQRIVEEAARQCGRVALPALDAPERFESFVETLKHHHALLLTLSAPGCSLSEQLEDVAQLRELTIMIGPEGDFSPEEAALAARGGARPVRLAGATLRSETAAIAAVVIVQHATGAL